MKLNGLDLLYENIEAVLAVVVLSIVFFVFWDKKNKQAGITQNDDQSPQPKENWYDVSRMDILSNKIGVLFLALLVLMYIAVFRR
ncbi:hypothetical protein ACXWTF_04390 [Thiomicrolovo sp. ZZH C-3]